MKKSVSNSSAGMGAGHPWHTLGGGSKASPSIRGKDAASVRATPSSPPPAKNFMPDCPTGINGSPTKTAHVSQKMVPNKELGSGKVQPSKGKASGIVPQAPTKTTAKPANPRKK